MKSKLLIVTDAWDPHVSGVSRTLQSTIQDIESRGDLDVHVVHPSLFDTTPMPLYPSIPVARNVNDKLEGIIRDVGPDYIHISTEGVLGWKARAACIKHNMAFTSAYHTMFPEYIRARLHIPEWVTYPVFRRFHQPAAKVFVATQFLEDLLVSKGFDNTFVRWSRGVNPNFPPTRITSLSDYALYVGRVSHEKNIEAFLTSDTPDLIKVVVGDGPQLDELRSKYPDVYFMGHVEGPELWDIYRSATVFVFPSVTDTFGLVLIEALASGTPIAAFPAPNCVEVVSPHVGCLDTNLSTAISNARQLDRTSCAQYARDNFSWSVCTDQFISGLVPTSVGISRRE